MKTIILCSLIVLMCVPALGQTNSLVQDNVPNAGPVYYFHQRKVARIPNGTLMVAWNNKAAAGGQVFYSIYDAAFQQWSPALAISNAGERAIQIALAADESGNIHATWQQRATSTDPYKIYYAKFNGVSWGTPAKISLNDAEASEEATIEVDSKGYLWVVYNNDGAGVGKEWIFARKSTDNGATWSARLDTLSKGGTIGTSIEVARVALTSGPGGNMAAAWDNHMTGSGTTPRETFVNQFDGTSWRGQELVTDTAATAAEARLGNRYSAIAIDQNSNILLFYHINRPSADSIRPRQLVMHRKAWNDSWSKTPTTVINSHPTAGGREVSAVVDSSNIVHLTFGRDIAADTAGLDEIVYTWSKNSGTTWATPIVMSRANRDGGYVTVANRVRKAYGIDIAWRESRDINRGDQDTTAIVYGNVPYKVVTAVEQSSLPTTFDLVRNYPNPFNPSTTIEYQIAETGRITLAVFDMLGREVKTLFAGDASSGLYRISWDGMDGAGAQLPSGVYYVRLNTPRGSEMSKSLLLK